MNPALAGVVVPTVFLIILAVVPYIDRSQEGQGTWFGTLNAVRISVWSGIFSFVHIDDAASATARAVETGKGIYNVCDDEPAPMSEWVPAYTEALGDGRTISISPDVETVLGCSQEEWMADGHLWVKLLHPEDLERASDLADQARPYVERAAESARDRARHALDLTSNAVSTNGDSPRSIVLQLTP